jgi:ribose 5-phosphate isomerase B
MRLALGSDHAGFERKQEIAEHLRSAGHTVIDVGPNDTTSVDYPDYAKDACTKVISREADGAVLICGSGIGISIAANKVDGIRCAVVYNTDTARLAREHNNAQAIAIGARFFTTAEANAMVDAWLGATFETRHQRRIDKIHALEKPAC